MGETARQIFSFPSARNVLAELLAPPPSKYAIDGKAPVASPPPSALTTQNTVAILRILSRPEMRDVAQDILSRPEVQERIPRLLMSPETRPLLLQALNTPGLPKFAPQEPAKTASMQSVIDAASAPRTSSAEIPPERIPQKVTDLFGSHNGPALSRNVMQEITIALQTLAAVSPNRAAQAIKTLEAFVALGIQNADDLVAQVTNRLETIAPQLAQKGGLPTDLSEPVLQTSTAIPLHIKNLPPEQLLPTVERLASKGAEITFVGRASDGSAQIFLLAAEMPSGSAERFASGIAANTLHTANLTRQEQASLATLMPNQHIESSINYTIASMFAWMPIDKPLKNETRIKDRGAQDESPQQQMEAVPSMLDLVRMEPLLLGYTPGELMVPGTDIPLILPPGWGKGETIAQSTTPDEPVEYTDYTVTTD